MMHQPNENPVRSLLSPSNFAAAALAGFLVIGQATDWKMLRGRPSKSTATVAPGSRKQPSRSAPPHSKTGLPASFETNPQSEVADRRATSTEGKGRSRLD